MVKKREDIENLRAVAIILVVLGHSVILYSDKWALYPTTVSAPPLNGLKDIINLIQMPLFFSISGFCLVYSLNGKRSFRGFLKNKLRRVVVPFLIIGALWLYPLRMLADYPAYQDVNPANVLVKYIYFGYDNGHLWFLPTLFLMLVLTDLIARVPLFESKPSLFDLSLVAIALLTVAIPVSWPYLGQFGQNYMWFVVGVLFHRHEKWIREVCTGGMKIVLVCAAGIGCLITGCGIESMLLGKILSLICVLVAYLVVPNHSTATLRKISRNSMGLYLFHSPLIYLSFNFWPNISPWLMVLINFVGFGAVAYGMTELVRKLGLGIVIGE